MGTKDNPSRKSRNKLIAGGLSAILVIGGLVAYDVHEMSTVIDEQSKLIHDHQQQLDEQGSLINQQEEQMNSLLDENVHLKDALEKQQGEYDQTKSNLEKSIEDYKESLKKKDQKIKGLEEDLTAKLEREAREERLRQQQVAADLAAKEEAKKVAAQKATVKKQTKAPEVAKTSPKPSPKAKAPVKVVAKAPAKAPAKPVASSESTVPSRGESNVAREFYVEATGYIAMCDTGCTGITATGIDLRNQPNLKVIAVDPNVIPLGSKVWVEGYGYAIAGDTGGAIKGNKIDVHMPTTQAAISWGRKKVKIKILK